jgi:hypothetical protein
MASAEDDKYSFKGTMINLMRHSLKIVAEENVPGAVTAIHNYRARFDATVDKHEIIHRNYVANIFQRYKDEILKGYEFDSWIIDNEVSIVFGSENPGASHKGYIPLSEIFRASKECVKKAKVKDDQLIIFPQIFMLHLYRAFSSIRNDETYSAIFDSEDTRESIQQQMIILETDLRSGAVGETNIKSNNLEFPSNANFSGANPTDALKAMMNDPMLDNIFSMVTNTFAQSGMVPKEELSKISVNDVRKQFNSILGSDALNKTFEMMSKQMSAAKTPEDAMKLSLGMMNDPTILEAFAQTAQPSKEEPTTTTPDTPSS